MKYTSPLVEDAGKMSNLIQGGPPPALDQDTISGRNVGNLLEDEN